MQPSAQYLKRHGRLPVPDGRMTPIVGMASCFVYTGMYFFLYTMYVSPRVTLVDTIILIIVGLVTTIIFASMMRKPEQFYRAFIERAFRPVAILLAIGIRLLGLISGLVLRILRIIFCLGVAIIYDISPIDLIPDFIIGIGWLDDVAVTILMIYLAFFGGRLILSYGFKEATRNLLAATQIKTKFP